MGDNDFERSGDAEAFQADRFIEHLSRECLPAIEQATIPILGIQNDKIVHDRTGVLYRIGDHRFILTAAHDLREIVGYNIPLYVCLNVDRTLPIPFADAKFYGTEPDGRDVAAILLTEDVANQVAASKRFIAHNEVRLMDDQRTGWYTVVGYPQDWSVWKLSESYLYSHVLPYVLSCYRGQPGPESGYHQEVHMLFGFEQYAWNARTRTVESLPTPHGMSGCGVWRVADRLKTGRPELSIEKPSLVGIQTSWNRDLKYIMATRLGWVLGRILDDYPELERPMNLIYPTNVRSSRIVIPRPWRAT